MTGRRVLALLRLLLIAGVAFLIGLHAVPASYLLPVLGMVITFGALLDDRVRTRDNQRQLEKEREKLKPPADGHRVRLDSGGTLRPAGELSLAELREKRQEAWEAAMRSVPTARPAAFTAKLRAIRELDEQIAAREAPAAQARAVAAEHGLPVVAPLMKRGLPALTEEEAQQFTEKWRALAGREPMVLERPPSVTAPPVSAGGPGPAWLTEEAQQPEQEQYTPAGERELVRELKRAMDEQAREARRTTWSAQRRREWRMSDEWYDLACQVHLPGPRGHLYGYPVVVSAQYGVPELTCV